MKARDRKEAWRIADGIFPTDYTPDSDRSNKAGYDVYVSTYPGNGSWISDLTTRLELNICDGNNVETTTIWIDEEPELGMTATVRSFTNDFKAYQIKNIVSVQYIANTLVLTYIKDGNVLTGTYNSSSIVVEIR